MYKVTIVNSGVEYVIHNSSVDNSVSKLSSGKISMEVNSISSFEFTMLANNVGFNRLTPYVTRVIVTNTVTGKEAFNGRVLKLKPKMSNKGLISKTVICEDRLGFLQDSIQPYCEEKHWDTDDDSTGLVKYLEYLLENHNNQVEEDKRIFLGNVTQTTLYSDNSLDKGTNYETTWEVIKTKLIDVFGGEITLRESSGTLYLDYLLEVGEEKDTVIEVAKNMASIDETIDYSEVFTKLIPLGAKLTTTDEVGNEVETEERLTIADINNGQIWITTSEETTLGSIVKTVEFDDITDANNLLTKAQEYIETEEVVTEQHNLSVVDLSIKDSSYDELEVGNYYMVKNSLLELEKKLRVIKKSLDICKPTSSSITVGDTQQTLSDITVSKGKDLLDVLQQITYITTNYAKNTALTNSYSQLTSLINQTYNQILLTISEQYVTTSDYETSLEKIAELELLIDQVTILVSEVSSLTNTTASLQVSLEGIQSQIGSITDVTTTQYGTGTITLENLNESELIALQVHPTKTSISYLYPSDDLYPADDLYPLARTLLFISDDETVKFEIPCDLWVYDDDTYDEFILDFEHQTMYVIHRVGIDTSGNLYALDEENTVYYDYESIILAGGTYEIRFLSFDDAFIYARGMVSNLYTSQYATRVELKSSITQSETNILEQVTANIDGINKTLSAKIELKVDLDNLISEINASADVMRLTSDRFVLSSTNCSISQDGTITASNVDLTGKITATSGSFTGSIYASSGTIGGWTISSSSMVTTYSSYQVGMYNASNTNKDFLVVRTGDSSSGYSYPFYVRGDGTLVATKATITGAITATSGSFTGTITATSGTIGGYTLSNYMLTGSNVGISSLSGYGWAFWAGSNTAGSAPFRVGHDGQMYASNATITGSVTATSGSFTGSIYASAGTVGGLKISSSRLYYGSNVAINTNGNVEFANSNGYFSIGSDHVDLFGNGKEHPLILSDYLSADPSDYSSYPIQIRSWYGNIRVATSSSGASVVLYGPGGVIINGTTYGSSSTKATKDNILELTTTEKQEIYDELIDLNIYSYDYKEKYGGKKNNVGFMIDEIENKKLYDLLHVNQLEEDEKVKTYSAEDLARVLLIAVQQLHSKIERLEEKVNEK